MPELRPDSTIVVIDDSSTARSGLSSSLKKLGFLNVKSLSSAEEALEMMEVTKVDLILCDQAMPGMTGTEFLHKVRRDPVYDDVPFLLVTGQVNSVVVAEMADYGGDSVLVKPFSAQVLEEKINQAIRSRWYQQGLENQGEEQPIPQIRGDLSGKGAQVIKTISKINPEDPKVVFARAVKAWKEGDSEAAEKVFKQLVETQPHFLKAREALADLYVEKGDTERALKHMGLSVEINPGNFQRRFDYAKLLMDSGQKEEAAEVLNKMLEEGCKYPELLMRVARAYESLGKTDDMVKSFHCSLEADRKNRDAYDALADFYRKKGQNGRLEELLREAAKAFPRDPESQWRYALVLKNAGKKSEALAQARRVLSVDENHEAAKKLYRELGGK